MKILVGDEHKILAFEILISKIVVIKVNDLYLPSAVFIAQRLVDPSKHKKQIIQRNKHHMVRIPTGRRKTDWLFARMTEELNQTLTQNNTS